MSDIALALSPAQPRAVHAPRYPEAVFHAEITPHCSLSETGHRIFISAVALIMSGSMIGLIAAGLWPVAVFLAIAGILLVCATRAVRRRLNRQEHVIVLPGVVVVQRFYGGIFDGERRIGLLGLTVACHQDPDFGCLDLALKRRAESIRIAGDLSPPEREEFRKALLDALWKAGARPGVSTSHGVSLAA
jgi:uncharacterized membrane protein